MRRTPVVANPTGWLRRSDRAALTTLLRVPTTPDNARFAVLIDADNTSPKDATALMEELAKYGTPTVRRAYGDWTSNKLSGWKDQLNRQAIQPIQQFAYTTGKNSTDFALVIDAMDLLFSGNLDGFAIVSSDSDFTRLVTRLRESGKTVYGFGRRKTPAPLQNACDRFFFLEVLGTEPVPAQASDDEDAEEAAPLPELRSILASAISDTSGDDGWAHLGAVGSVLNTRYPSFDPRNYGFAKLILLVRAQKEVEVTPEGPPMVRLRGARRRRAAAPARAAGPTGA